MAYTAMVWQTTNIENTKTLSSAIDLGRIYDLLQVDFPAMNACSIGIDVSRTGGTYNILGGGIAVNISTGSRQEVFKIAGHQFLKLNSSATQTANRSFYYRGIAE